MKATERDTKVKQTLRFSLPASLSLSLSLSYSLVLKTSICYNGNNNNKSNKAHNNNNSNNLTANISIPRNATTFQLYLDRCTSLYIYLYIYVFCIDEAATGWLWSQVKCPCPWITLSMWEEQQQQQQQKSLGSREKKSIVQVKVKLFEELLPDVSGCPNDLLSFHAFIVHDSHCAFSCFPFQYLLPFCLQIAIDTLSLQL